MRCPLTGSQGGTMEVLSAGCAGLDVHNYSVEACVRKAGTEGQVSQTIRHWGTATRQLMAMADWLQAEGVTHVAMESTGVYWSQSSMGGRGSLRCCW